MSITNKKSSKFQCEFAHAFTLCAYPRGLPTLAGLVAESLNLRVIYHKVRKLFFVIPAKAGIQKL